MALQALPLLALHLQAPPKGMDEENRAYAFCFLLNKTKTDLMFALGRAVTLTLALALGWLLFLAARPFGSLVCAFSLLLWSFDPTFLAWAPTIKTDVPSAFFFLATFLLFQKAQNSKLTHHYAALGFVAGMACTCKLSCITLFPAMLLSELCYPLDFRSLARRWIWITSFFFLWLCFLYAPGFWKYPFPWTPLHEWIQRIYDLNLLRGKVIPVFFMGHLQNINSWLYFTCAYCLKSSLPFLILLTGGVVLVLRKRLVFSASYFLFPSLFFLAMIIAPPGGVRYLLPLEAFAILLAARCAAWAWEKNNPFAPRLTALGIALLLSLHVLSVGSSFPNHIGYFNESVSRERRFHILGGYDFDAGQDLKRLVQTAQQRGWKNVKLAYSEMTDPSFYGLTWDRWTQKDLEGPQTGWVYVTSISFLQSAPGYYPQTFPIAMSWIRRTPPTGIIGGTWIYYESPDAHFKPDSSSILDSVPYLRRPNSGSPP